MWKLTRSSLCYNNIPKKQAVKSCFNRTEQREKSSKSIQSKLACKLHHRKGNLMGVKHKISKNAALLACKHIANFK